VIVATNTSDHPNPAGLIGKLIVELEGGKTVTVAVDERWKSSDKEQPGWTSRGFDDSSWKPARKIAPFGGGPWKGPDASGLTLSPVKADPFVGHVEIPSDIDTSRARLVLELEGLAPEEAARISVNGQYAGGFIGRPLRLDLSSSLKPGYNTVSIEPFAPKAARVAVLAR
jgi:alpha-L-rhamnosidase